MSFLPWEGLLLAPEPCLVSLGLPGWCCSGAVPVLLRTAISQHQAQAAIVRSTGSLPAVAPCGGLRGTKPTQVWRQHRVVNPLAASSRTQRGACCDPRGQRCPVQRPYQSNMPRTVQKRYAPHLRRRCSP